jgi:hypothetical protein
MTVAVLVFDVVPAPSSTGSALALWTIVRRLVESGHTVKVVVLHGPLLDDPGASVDERVDALRSLGADVRLLRSRAEEVFDLMDRDPVSRLRRAWQPPDVQLFPNLLDVGLVREALDELAPDVVYVYHWEALAASRAVRGLLPRLATVVDLPQLSSFYRWRSGPGRFGRRGLARLLWLQGRLRRQPQLMVDLLAECEASGNFAAHHAAWLRRKGAAGCVYLHTPVEDQAGGDWRGARSRRPERPRLLLIGHLRGASTLAGLRLFTEQVLPRLERALGPDGFEVRVVGAYEPPEHLRAALARASVRVLGYVDRVDEEFASADALLVPTSIPLGTRVRIISAFSFGCPVVAHRANALGIPELAHEENVLLGRSAGDLVDGFVRLARDESLRARLEQAGRATFEQYFAPSAAAARIEAMLEGLAARPRAQVPTGRP